MKRATILLLLLIGGCQYYKVTDNSSGKEYVTNNWNMDMFRIGPVRFKELEHDKIVNLSSYELQPISSDQARGYLGRLK